MFKRNFAVLLSNLAIERYQSGCVKPNVIEAVVDVENIKNLNWCEYTMKKLIDLKGAWEKDQENAFRGPILLLMVSTNVY